MGQEPPLVLGDVSQQNICNEMLGHRGAAATKFPQKDSLALKPTRFRVCSYPTSICCLFLVLAAARRAKSIPALVKIYLLPQKSEVFGFFLMQVMLHQAHITNVHTRSMLFTMSGSI